MLPVPATLTYVNKSPEPLGLLPLVAVSPITPTSAEQAAWARLKPGAMYQARIIEQTKVLEQTQHEQAKQAQQHSASATVMSRVQIQQADNQIVQMWMHLPAGLTGKGLQLQFAGKPNQLNPQVKWQLAGETALKQLQANQIGLSVPINLEIDDDATLSNIPIQATKVQLSDTGKTLNAWRESSLFPSQTQTYEARHIVSLHPERPQVLAQDLKHALDSSGLFYESHLKNASLGTQSWQSLSQEPQNQAQFVPASMVAQQLQVLEQQRVVWHGEVWPGQQMQWAINEAPARQSSAEEPEPVNTLKSDLTIHLPNLGEVTVSIVMVAGHLTVSVVAKDVAAATRMRDAKSLLAMNMEGAGLKLDNLTVRAFVERAERR